MKHVQDSEAHFSLQVCNCKNIARHESLLYVTMWDLTFLLQLHASFIREVSIQEIGLSKLPTHNTCIMKYENQ